MSAIVAVRPESLAGRTGEIVVREATVADNPALVALSGACTMEGEIALRMDRAPDFFALNRLEGDAWRVGVAVDAGGRVAGCVAVARRDVWLHGREGTIAYVGDLKVHPRARGSAAADRLTTWAAGASDALCGSGAPRVATILAGNASMERRARGPRGMPALARFATLAAAALPFVRRPRERLAGLTVRPASPADFEAMAALWTRLAPARQLAATLTAASLAAWVARAPGLSSDDYLLAHDARGRLRGFVGLWDQRAFKQMRVVGYSTRLAWARRAINLAAPLAGLPPLPPAGEPLDALACVHACAHDAAALRALLLEALRRRRGDGYAFVTLGLDARDPLRAALHGLFAQTTSVHAYVNVASGDPGVAALAARPLHHETALV